MKKPFDTSKQHTWKRHYRHASLDADAAAEVLNSIFARDGSIQAQAVVDEAKPGDSPIHDGFEWDDCVAANEHRKWQARNLTRSIEVVVADDAHEAARADSADVQTIESSAAFVYAGNGNEQTPSGYYPVEVVREDLDLFDRAMQDAQRKLRSAEHSVAALKRIAGESSRSDQLRQIALAAQALSTAQAALAQLPH